MLLSFSETSNLSNSTGHSNEKEGEVDSGSLVANQEPRSSESVRRRKRRKVLKSKTSMDEGGFMGK